MIISQHGMILLTDREADMLRDLMHRVSGPVTDSRHEPDVRTQFSKLHELICGTVQTPIRKTS